MYSALTLCQTRHLLVGNGGSSVLTWLPLHRAIMSTRISTRRHTGNYGEVKRLLASLLQRSRPRITLILTLQCGARQQWVLLTGRGHITASVADLQMLSRPRLCPPLHPVSGPGQVLVPTSSVSKNRLGCKHSSLCTENDMRQGVLRSVAKASSIGS